MSKILSKQGKQNLYWKKNFVLDTSRNIHVVITEKNRATFDFLILYFGLVLFYFEVCG